MLTFFFNTLAAVRAVLFRLFQGKHLGRKFPLLWRGYDFLYRAFSPKRVFFHELSGSRFLVDLTDPDLQMRRIMEDYSTLSVYEPATTKLVWETEKSGSVAIDIGASIGYFTLLLSKLAKTVYAFEPTQFQFRYLCENIRENKRDNIKAFNMAAWDRNEPVFVPVNAVLPYRVWSNGVSLDDFLGKEGVERVDFIKIDVDGAEPQVLRGLRKTIEKNRNLTMVIEYYPKYIENAGGSPQEVVDFLETFFTCRKILGDPRVTGISFANGGRTKAMRT